MNCISLLRMVRVAVALLMFCAGASVLSGGAEGTGTNYVLRLGGTNGYAQLPAGAFADVEEITVEGWVRWERDLFWTRFFDFGVAGRSVNVGRYMSTPSLNLEISLPQNQIYIPGIGLFKTNEWMHLAAVVGRQELKLYFNGELAVAQTNGAAFKEINGSERNFLGRNNWFDANAGPLPDAMMEIDEFRVWNGVRTADQIRDGLFASMRGDEPGLICLLNFQSGAKDLSPRRMEVKLGGDARVTGMELPSKSDGLTRMGIVQGKILDKEGKGVEGAVLQVKQGTTDVLESRSGSEGEFRFGVVSDKSLEITARSNDRAGESGAFNISPGQTLEKIILLHPPLSISGSVTAFNKSPLSGIVVELLREDASAGDNKSTTTTDLRGNYSFEFLAPSDYQVRVIGRNGSVSYKNGEALRLTSGVKLTDINFVIAPLKKGSWQEFNSGNGLPSDVEVRKILFEPNGITWFATESGAARFDGVEYQLFTSEQGLPDDKVLNMARDAKGNIWFSTSTGIARYDGKLMKAWGKEDGVPGVFIDGILADKDGSVWFSGDGGAFVTGQRPFLFNFDGEKFKYFSETNGLPGRVYKMALGKENEIWMCGWFRSLVRFDRTNFTRIEDPKLNVTTDTPSVAPDGTVWFGANGAWRYDGKQLRQFTSADGLNLPYVIGTYCAPDGSVWLAGRAGAARYDGTNFTTITRNDGQPLPQVISVTGAPDGSIWFGTFSRGALRYESDVFENFTIAHGLRSDETWQCGKMADGRVWFSSAPRQGIQDSSVWDGTEFVAMEEVTGVKGWKGDCAESSVGFLMPTRTGLSVKKGNETRTFSTADGMPVNFVYAAREARDGSIWVTSGPGAGRYLDGKWTAYNQTNGLPLSYTVSVLPDRTGRVWFGNYRAEGLALFENEQWKHFTTTNGLAGSTAWDLFEDDDGSIWIGTDAGLSQFKDGRFINYFKGKDRIPNRKINCVFRDSRGHLWVGTPGGAARFDGKVWSTLRTYEGLVGDYVQCITEDNSGTIWIGTDTGLTSYRPIKRPALAPGVVVVLDKIFSGAEQLPPILKGRRVQFRAEVGDMKTKPETRRFIWGVFPGSPTRAEMLAGSAWMPATSNPSLEWTAPAKGDYTLAVQYVDRDLNYSEPVIVPLKVVPPWYMNAFIAAPAGAVSLGLLGWAFIARSLYMQKRREAERLRERIHQQEHEARLALEQKNRQLEKAMEAAESASRTKSQFLATMSHELRTPLNAILGYSEMLEEELEERAAQELVPDVQKIQGAGKHLLGLINDILDLSKIEAGKMTIYSESFDIAATVQDIANTVAPLIKRNNNTLTVNIEPQIGSMHSDLTKVRQTLFNLLSNAAKFTENGSITVDVSAPKGTSLVQFTIRDNGIGMNQEQLAKLFQAFTQADASTSRRYGGTGLGLVLSRNFCRLLGGDIEVSSEDGKGSVFVVRLPRRVELSTGSIATPEATPASTNGRAHVLVIDDDPNVRELMNRHLTKEGYAVSLAASGEQGLALARQRKPDIITVDIIMPGQDGWSVLSALKADESLNNVPVVLVSMVDEKQLGFSLGAADYIVKPINWERLSGALQKLRPELTSNEILVVEDDETMREMFTRQLEKHTWSVRTAENGRVALDALRIQAPSVILLDLMMPEMDGFAFLEEMRRNRDWQHIPVIVVTAKDLSQEDLNELEGRIRKVVQKSAHTIEDVVAEIRAVRHGQATQASH